MSTATDKSHPIWRCEGTVKMPYALPTFLPGQLTLDRGFPRDYLELEQFHYLPKRPATWCQVWTIHYHPPLISGGDSTELVEVRHGRVFCRENRSCPTSQ